MGNINVFGEALMSSGEVIDYVNGDTSKAHSAARELKLVAPLKEYTG